MPELIKTRWYPESVLKAYYRFESGALTTDSSGESHTLTAISDPAEDASGKFGGAVALDSNDCYSIVDHADLKPAGVFTVGAWVKGSASTTTRTIWNTYLSSGGKLYGFFLQTDTNELPEFFIAKGTGAVAGTDYKVITGSTSVLDGNWHFVVGVWDGTNMNLYVDGKSDATPVAAFNAAYTGTMYQRIGARNSTGTDSNFFIGSLDDVFLLNGKALNAYEVLSIYQTISPGAFLMNLASNWKNN
jgi:hypothetical protein